MFTFSFPCHIASTGCLAVTLCEIFSSYSGCYHIYVCVPFHINSLSLCHVETRHHVVSSHSPHLFMLPLPCFLFSHFENLTSVLPFSFISPYFTVLRKNIVCNIFLGVCPSSLAFPLFLEVAAFFLLAFTISVTVDQVPSTMEVPTVQDVRPGCGQVLFLCLLPKACRGWPSRSELS